MREFFQLRVVQLLTLTMLLGAVVWRAFNLKFCVLDLDIWWHLKVGDWIQQNHSFPHNGIFSRTAANRPWIAYSWGYEVLLSRAYHWFDLVGVGVFGTLLTVAVAYSVYWMTRRLSGRFWFACLVAVAACSAFLYNLMPRPVFLSIVLFTIVLTSILEANRSGRVRALYWLPLIFMVWANVHIQFIYGLFLVGLLLGVNVVQHLLPHLGLVSGRELFVPSGLPTERLAIIFVACLLATCIGPYSYHLYGVIYEYTQAQTPYFMIRELQPINFRAYSHYMQLLLTGAGFFAVGWRKRVDLFKLALLIVASVVAYRTMRDSWFVCITAAACIADFPAEGAEFHRGESMYEKLGLAVAVALLMLLFARNTDFNQTGLDAAISSQFPVKAANFLRKNPQPGPLYNSFDWGGFLIWYMPNYPVAIDGRNDLYGDDLDRLFFNTQIGNESYAINPYLNEAGLVLLQKSVPLANLLTSDPRFQLIYQDRLAAVFVRR